MTLEEAHVPDGDEVVPLTTPVEDGLFFRVGESILILVVLALGLVLEYGPLPENLRDIPAQFLEGAGYVRNLLFNEEEAEESVGTVTLIVVGVVLPFLLQLAMATWDASHQRPFDRYNTVCSYFMAFSLSLVVVDATKIYVGYYRPHFYDLCQPNDTYQVCSNEDDSAVRDGRLSFPSGHAALSLSGMGNLSLFLWRRYGVGKLSTKEANTRKHQIARMWSCVSILPVFVSLYMGVSRIHDNYHHPADVVAGFGIGAMAAYFCHHVWFLE